MSHQKMSVPIWTHKIVKKGEKKFVHLPLPDNTEMVVEFESQEELKAAQYKARATAKGIVHAKFSYAF
jgi:hypothetical protein